MLFDIFGDKSLVFFFWVQSMINHLLGFTNETPFNWYSRGLGLVHIFVNKDFCSGPKIRKKWSGRLSKRSFIYVCLKFALNSLVTREYYYIIVHQMWVQNPMTDI